MSDAVVGSRANRAVTALAALLEEATGAVFYSQWAGPETGLKDILAAGDSAGCVTCGGATVQTFDGTEEYEEPADGADSVLQKFGTETLLIQVDVWSPSLDDRWVMLGKLETFFDGGAAESEDGALFLTLSDGASARFIRTGSRIADSSESAGGREWRATIEMEAEVDIVAREYAAPLVGIVAKLRHEDSTDPPPPPNALGKTLAEQEFSPEG